MSKKSNNVPRGLSELFKSNENFDKINALSKQTREEGKRRKVLVEKLISNPFQPRLTFDDEKLKELADSIKNHGLIQPIIVRRGSDINFYEIIAGERRARACKIAGIEEVDVIVQSWDDKITRQMTLLENIQREDLNHIEIAKSYKSLQEELELTQNEIAEMVSKKRSTVTNFMRLLDLPSKTQKMVENREISGSFARTLLSLKDDKLIEKWSKDDRIKSLSVSALDKRIKDYNNKNTLQNTVKLEQQKDIKLIEFENRLSLYLDASVKIGPKLEKGKISISFNSEEELKEILTKLNKNFEI